MKGYQFSGQDGLPNLDITQPDGPVVVEIDENRGVLWVHIEGFTCLRICRASRIVVTNQETKLIHTVGFPANGQESSPISPMPTSEEIGKEVLKLGKELLMLPLDRSTGKVSESFQKQMDGLLIDPHRQAASQMFEVPYDEVTEEQRMEAKKGTVARLYGKNPNQP